jgi:hypothetical protein
MYSTGQMVKQIMTTATQSNATRTATQTQNGRANIPNVKEGVQRILL